MIFGTWGDWVNNLFSFLGLTTGGYRRVLKNHQCHLYRKSTWIQDSVESFPSQCIFSDLFLQYTFIFLSAIYYLFFNSHAICNAKQSLWVLITFQDFVLKSQLNEEYGCKVQRTTWSMLNWVEWVFSVCFPTKYEACNYFKYYRTTHLQIMIHMRKIVYWSPLKVTFYFLFSSNYRLLLSRLPSNPPIPVRSSLIAAYDICTKCWDVLRSHS